ncbi:hydantoinase/oxoprolinase family protein [Marinibaculum pumilum]|uniref:Hydantoinase/oxoprolinase family protein n=1 Tax=Marinibaculum pumilum TaxID=1766165 RepID=A0ABV7KTI2_9PROT
MTATDLAVDIGGTFVDVVARGPDGALRIAKLPSSRAAPEAAMAAALDTALAELAIEPAQVASLRHGTTVATNALVERKGARLGLITTAGFRDVLELGRQNRRDLYDPVARPRAPVFLVPRRLRLEVAGRIAADGTEVEPLDEAAVAAAADDLAAAGVEAVAIVFLFAHLDPAHERRAAEILRDRQPGLALSLSSEADPRPREFERTGVTCFDAYVKPVVGRYLDRVAAHAASAGIAAPLQVVTSAGWLQSAGRVAGVPSRLLLSGPAAGVLAAATLARDLGEAKVATIDIGGTTSDLALVLDGVPAIRQGGSIDGHDLRVPMVDVAAIGAGGGSIARVAAGGSLQVGPESAGADPGPACLGLGGERATLTDASLLLGYLDPQGFAGGRLALRPDLAEAAIRRDLAAPLDLPPVAAALGAHRIANVQMANALRLAALARGLDSRDLTLMAMGGAGGLHAAAIAGLAGIRRVVVPPAPGAMAAIGLFCAPVTQACEQPLMRASDDILPGEIVLIGQALAGEAEMLMRAEGVPAGRDRLHFEADLAFARQSHPLTLAFEPEGEDPVAALGAMLEAEHERLFGFRQSGAWKLFALRAVRQAPPLVDRLPPPAAAAARPPATRRVAFDADGPVPADVLDRAGLGAGETVTGPAVIAQADSTTLLPPGWSATVLSGGSLLLQPAAGAAR